MEMLVVMTLFSMLLAMVFTILINLTYQASDNLARERAVQQARLGVSQIDRQVRSGNLIKDPAADGVAESGVSAGYSMRLYTQEGGELKCAQWRVNIPDEAEFGNLEYRTWDPDYELSWGDVADWYVVAQNSVAAPVSGTIDAADPQTWPPFWIDANQNSGTSAQSIRVTLRILDPLADDRSKPVVVSTVVTGRNTVFGYSDSNCSVIPPV